MLFRSMSRYPSLLIACLMLVLSAQAKEPGYYNYGKPASAEEIAGWDIDIRPDGAGLPPGGGTVEEGEWLYEDQCAECHGSFGEGVGRYPALSGGEGTLTDARPHKTVGSFWPHTSTLWDYIHRAMPFTQPESLSDNEVYAVTAYVLYLNDLVDYEFELTRDNFAEVELPNKANFHVDERPDTANTRCMKNCKDPGTVTITSRVVAAPVETAAAPAAATAVDAVTSGTETGRTAYAEACALCHDSGLAGAPKMGDAAAWAARSEQGMEVLVRHAIEGYQGDAGMMPPKGGFLHLSDQQVTDAVLYMIEASQ